MLLNKSPDVEPKPDIILDAGTILLAAIFPADIVELANFVPVIPALFDIFAFTIGFVVKNDVGVINLS